MGWSLLDRFLLAVFLLAVIFVGQECARAQVACASKCIPNIDFEADGALGTYWWRYQTSDCKYCFDPNGLCTDPGPTLSNCSPNTTVQMLAFADNGNLVCTLNPNGYAEATNLKNVGKFSQYGFVNVCGGE